MNDVASVVPPDQLQVVARALEDSGAAEGVDPTALSGRHISGGRSNETFVIALGGQPRWVLRRPPAVGRTPSAHDVAREHCVTNALAQAGFPVARPLVLDDRPSWGPFTLVDYVDGLTIRSRQDLARLDDSQVDKLADALIETLASLHALDYRALGLGDFGRPDGYAQRQLRRWSGQWDVVGDDRPEAQMLLEKLQKTVPRQGGAAIVHGDYRVDNVLVRLTGGDPTIAAVVDWELSTIGDPSADVALMAVYRHEALDDILDLSAAWASARWPSPRILAERYATRSGHSLDDWDFHVGLAAYKVAVISAGIAYRANAAATETEDGISAGAAVGPMLEAGLSGWGS